MPEIPWKYFLGKVEHLLETVKMDIHYSNYIVSQVVYYTHCSIWAVFVHQLIVSFAPNIDVWL